jgi:hypothetical protein
MNVNLDDWTHWLYGYLAIGVFTAIIFLLLSYKERPSKFTRDVMTALGHGKTIKQYLQDILVYSIATLTIVIGWPGFLIWAAKKKLESTREVKKKDEPQFTCKPQHLVRKVDPIQAEEENMIHDPLGMTPKLPFGHLNASWTNFLADFGFEEENELWYFEIPPGTKTNRYLTSTTLVSGYAKVVNGRIMNEILIESD